MLELLREKAAWGSGFFNVIGAEYTIQQILFRRLLPVL